MTDPDAFAGIEAGPPVPTPFDMVGTMRRLADAKSRVDAWNLQMTEVARTIIAAALTGHGVIISYSYANNTIEAAPSPTVEAGKGVLFNRDTENPRPAFTTIRPEHLPRSIR